MEKVFEDLLATERGKQVVFDVIATAFAYRKSVQTPVNPLMKSLGKTTLSTQRTQELLFHNLAAFEALINELYTFNDKDSQLVDDLTSEPK